MKSPFYRYPLFLPQNHKYTRVTRIILLNMKSNTSSFSWDCIVGLMLLINMARMVQMGRREGFITTMDGRHGKAWEIVYKDGKLCKMSYESGPSISATELIKRLIICHFLLHSWLK